MKTILSGVIVLMALPAFATPITSPFYLPQGGHVVSQTVADYTKNKAKETPSVRTYRKKLGQRFTLGLGAGLAALLEGELDWTRQKQQMTVSRPHTKSYGAGLKSQWTWDKTVMQIATLYHQTTNVDFDPRREIQAHVRLGQSLKTMTPYLHLTGTFPLNAWDDLNMPVYRAETGVFQPIKTSMTLDTALYLQYDKNTKERSYGIRGEWSYMATSWMAVSLNGEWQARGKTAGNTKTYHGTVGAKLTFAF